MIGDKLVDIKAGEAFGINSYLCPYGHSKKYRTVIKDEQLIKDYKSFMEMI